MIPSNCIPIATFAVKADHWDDFYGQFFRAITLLNALEKETLQDEPTKVVREITVPFHFPYFHILKDKGFLISEHAENFVAIMASFNWVQITSKFWVRHSLPLVEGDKMSYTLDEIPALLRERGQEYGDFAGHAKVTQFIKNWIAVKGDSWSEMTDSQLEALDMICHKIGRIVNGNPNNIDSWKDLAGYAMLIVKQLEGENL